MDLPRVLIVSTAGGDKAANIAREMGSEFLADKDNTRYHVWTIDNKYYTAKVLLCATAADSHSADAGTQGVEALVLHHDPKAEKDTKSLDDCLPLVHSLADADIFLLVCEPFDSVNSREKVTEWSHTNKFELVETEGPMSMDHIMDDDAEDQLFGIDRIVEALHTHLWPNRVLKESPNARVEAEADVDEVEDQLGGIRLSAGTRDHSEQLLMSSVLDGIMGEEDTDFGELFGRLMEMKQLASSLPSNRRAAAEQLVTAFWKAIGEDPSEVEDLDQ